MPNHKRPRLLARATTRMLARHRAAPRPPAVPAEQPDGSRTPVAAELDAIRVLEADPWAPPVSTWTIGRSSAHLFGGAVVRGQLDRRGQVGDEAAVALLATLADTYGGTVAREDHDLSGGYVGVSARIEVCGVPVSVWTHVRPSVCCGRCGALCADDSSTAYVSDGTRACQACAAEIVAEAADEGGHDQEHDDADATKATQQLGGVTSQGDACDNCGTVTTLARGLHGMRVCVDGCPVDRYATRDEFVAAWLPKVRPLVVAAGGAWVPERVTCVLVKQDPSAVMTLTHDRAVDLLSALEAEGVLVLDDREGVGYPRWTAPLPTLPPVDQDDEAPAQAHGLPMDVMHATADGPVVQAHYAYGEDDHSDAEPDGLCDIGTDDLDPDDVAAPPEQDSYYDPAVRAAIAETLAMGEVSQ